MRNNNLLTETINTMAKYRKTPDDVKWVGGKDQWFTWADFAPLANTSYDNGFGGQQIASDLIVVGADWWIERHEYDGSEWWEFKTLPQQPERYQRPTTLVTHNKELAAGQIADKRVYRQGTWVS